MTELVLIEPGELSPPELAEIANREHQLAVGSGLTMLEHAILAGQSLIHAKGKVEHGEWLPWLDANFEASQPTASRYMTIARNYARVNSLEEPSLRKALQAITSGNNRAERDRAIAERRTSQLELATAEIQASGETPQLHHADIHTWRPTGVDAIITDPPYITDDAVELHSALADFAIDVLPDGGALAILTWQPLLPDVFAALNRPELIYRWTAAWIYETSARTPERKPRVFDGWKPILVYHKAYIPEDVTYLYDTINSPDADKDHHGWGQSPEGFAQLVRAFSRPGQIICDPFMGGGTTAVAALAEIRRFIGCDIDPGAVETTRLRLRI